MILLRGYHAALRLPRLSVLWMNGNNYQLSFKMNLNLFIIINRCLKHRRSVLLQARIWTRVQIFKSLLSKNWKLYVAWARFLMNQKIRLMYMCWDIQLLYEVLYIWLCGELSVLQTDSSIILKIVLKIQFALIWNDKS